MSDERSPELIPREALFGNPERTLPALNPAGDRLAYLAPDDKDVLQVWVRPLEGEDKGRAVTRDPKRGVKSYRWTEDGRGVLYAQDYDGDENWHIFLADLDSGLTRDLTPFLGAQAQLLSTHRDHPGQVLVTMNTRDPQLHDVFRVDLTSGAIALDTENPGDVIGWMVDDAFVVRGCWASRPDGGFEGRVRDAVEDDWRSLIVVPHEDADTSPAGFTKDGSALYFSSCVGRDTLQLVKKSLADGSEEVIASADDSDLRELIIDRETREPQAVCFGRARAEWTVLDPALEDDFSRLRALHGGDPLLISRDRADRRWILAFTTDDGPVPFYLYDREDKSGRLLFTSRPALEGKTLAAMEPVEIMSRDGLRLQSYLTAPPGRGADERAPLVLLVHGGPWTRDSWGYHPEAQWLANRGYACLQVNYRGSTGFGKGFVNAGNREWAAKMHDDLIDAVEWAIDSGIADRERVAIYGGSYGGYAALVGAAFTPDVFCCAVDIVGPSNLKTLLESFPPYWEPLKKLMEKRVGSLDDPEFLAERSPLSRVDAIKIPLLIAQGANDPRVKQAESEQIVEAVRAKGKEVDYMLFEDEGHGFARPENRMKFYAAAESFLAKHLGGRCEA